MTHAEARELLGLLSHDPAARDLAHCLTVAVLAPIIASVGAAALLIALALH